MKILEMPAEYEYYCAPKIRKDAYLTARITDFAGLGLLRGQATLFFGGKYLGKTLLDPSAVSDTLDISLGADKSVIVRRERLKNYSKKQFLGSNKTETRAWEISVKNSKSGEIRFVLEDQMPVSTLGDTEVTAEQLSGADYNKTTGKLPLGNEARGRRKPQSFLPLCGQIPEASSADFGISSKVFSLWSDKKIPRKTICFLGNFLFIYRKVNQYVKIFK